MQASEPAFDHTGASFDSFLEEEGILEQVEAVAKERVTTRQQDEVEKTLRAVE